MTTFDTSKIILACGLGFILVVAFKSKISRKKVAEDEEETFESHICDHDGHGLVNLSPSVLWHVTAKFHGNGPPWRRMIVYRPPPPTSSSSNENKNSLILLSPTAVPDDIMEEIDKLGEVAFLIIPNSYHRTDAAVFKKRYPKAKVASPPGWVRKGISEVVSVDMDVRELNEIYKDSVKVIRIGGLCDQSEAEGDFEYGYEFKCSDGSWAYAVTDTLFNFPEAGFMNWLFGTRGIVQPDDGCGTTKTTPRCGRVSKWFMHSRPECANFYRQMAEKDDVSMILMAHGDVLVGQEDDKIQNAFKAIAADVDTK